MALALWTSVAAAQAVGLANPASVFCIEQGGTLELRNTMEGSVGYCHLPDGTVIEEWELFRAKGPKT
jgi:putative hemolysin